MSTMSCPSCTARVPLRKGKKTVCFECGWQNGVRTSGTR